jgi:uncharacterized protein YjbI with pentapeptide repeats/RimJ/RimL family protein N-acetyltransferase
MIFNGKYTFQSTNATGPQQFLTSSSSQGMTYPTVSAGVATETERFITYQNQDGSLVIQMGDLFYLSAIEEVGWVVGNTSLDEAYEIKLVDEGGGQVSMQIYLTVATQWMPVRYSVNVQLPYLVFPIPGSKGASVTGDTYYNFTLQQTTPSLAQIQSSKSARGLDFRNVDLSGSDLSGVDCTGADFTNATLDGVNFSGATLSQATFIGASLNRTNLSGATLEGAVFTGTNLTTVDWGEAISARGTNFTECVAIGCQIGSSDMSKQADFTEAIFTGADFSGSDFSNSNLSQALLIRGVFIGAIFEQVNFTAAQLGGLDKTAAANLAFAYMPNVNFSKANLFGVSFAFSTLFGASTSMTSTATMEQADFSNAYLEGIDLTGGTLCGAKFNNACLVNVNFTKANLSPTLDGSIASSLDGACVQGAIFTQSTLENADLTNATVSFSQGSINVRYCNPVIGGPFPPPPQFEPLHYSATAGLDFTTMTADTICPNGMTVNANQKLGNSLTQMLTISSPATQWIPLSCTPSQSDQEAAPEVKNDSTTRNSSVVIETPNVELKTFSLRHFRNLRRLADDPEARHYFFWNQKMSDNQLKAMIHHYRLRHKKTGVTCWPAYRKADGSFIGVCGLAENNEAGGVEINVAVMPEFRGDPMVKEMYRAVLDYGFSRLGVERIFGMIEEENTASEKFMAKIGFRFIRNVLVRGFIPFKLYEITRDGF